MASSLLLAKLNGKMKHPKEKEHAAQQDKAAANSLAIKIIANKHHAA